MNFLKKHQKTLLTLALCIGCFTLMSVSGLALNEVADADISAVTGPLDRIYILVAAIISGIGSIFLMLSIPGLASSFNSHDTAQQLVGGLKVAASLLIAVAPWVVKYILG